MHKHLLNALFIAFLTFFSSVADAQTDGCCDNCPLPLPQLESGDILLTISGAANNDLSNPNQGVCGVTLHFTHEWIGDLRLVLYSPAGDSVTLIGPINTDCGETDGSEWDITFVPCNATANPDPLHNPTFDGQEVWGINGNFTGSYYPHSGCLEDFNTGPVTGTWTLHWVDGLDLDVGTFLDYDIQFCDPTGVTCTTCLADGGDVNTTAAITECFGSPVLALSMSPVYTPQAPPDPASYGYTFLIVDQATNSIIAMDPTADMTTLPPGQYSVCGLSYLLDDANVLPTLIGMDYNAFVAALSSATPPLCGDLSANCRPVTITSGPPDVTTDSTICFGEYVIWGGQQIYTTGTYTQIEQDINTGCSYNHILNLTVIDPIFPSFNPVGPLCQGDPPVNLPFTSLEGITGYWDFNPFDPSAVSPGDITINFTPDPGQCAQPTQMTITVTPGVTPTFAQVGPLCESDGPVMLPTTSNEGITGSWDVNPFDPAAGTSTVTFTPDAGQCAQPTQMTITVTPAVTPTFAQVGPLCESDGPVMLPTTSNEGITGSWDVNPFDPAAGTSTVTFTPDAGQCAQPTQMTIDVNPLPAINISAVSPLCATDAPITLTATPAGGTFSGNGVTGTNFDPSLAGPGMHTITYDYTDPNTGCSNSGNITIEVQDCGCANPPVVDAGADQSACADAASFNLTATVTNAPGGSWSGGAGVFTPDANSLTVTYVPDAAEIAAGSVTLTFTSEDPDGAGPCLPASDDVVLTINALPVVSAGSYGPLCLNDAAISLTGSPAGGTFSGPGVSNGMFDPALVGSAGMITITYDYTDPQTGCSNSATTTIEVQDCGCANPPVVDAGADQSACADAASFNLTATVTNAPGGSWSGGAGVFTPDANSLTVTYVPDAAEIAAGSVTLMFTSEDPDGAGPCSAASDDVVLTMTKVAISDVTMSNGGQVDCAGNPVTLTAITTGTGTLSMHWEDDSGTVISSTAQANVGTAGDYTFVLSNSDGCQADTTVTVGSLSGITVDIAVNGSITCYQPTTDLVGSASTPNGTYVWQLPDGTTLNDAATITVGQGGDYTLTVTDPVTNCVGSKTVFVVEETDMPVVTLASDTLSCLDTLATITATGNGTYAYDWTYPDSVTTATGPALANVSQAGLYQLQVTDTNNGCVLDTTVLLAADTVRPNLTATGNSITCDQPAAQLFAFSTTPGVSFEWNGPNNYKTNDPNPVVQEPGNYLLKAFGPNGCVSEDTVLVAIDTVSPPMEAGTSDTIDCVNQTALLVAVTPSSIVDFTWYSPNGQMLGQGDSIAVDAPGTYTVVGTDQNSGCTSEDDVVVNADLEVPVVTLTVNGVVNCYGNPVQAVLNSDQPLDSVSWTGQGIQMENQMTVALSDPGLYHVFFTGENGCTGQSDFMVDADTTAPVAHAVSKFMVTCATDQGFLGVDGSSTGSQIQYLWTATGQGQIVSGDSTATPSVRGTGLYQLLVTNVENGCTATDSVEVESDGNTPTDIVYNALPVRCYGMANGSIIVNDVVGGAEPYLYKINDEAFTTERVFSPLAPGTYAVVIQDANGCTLERQVTIDEPDSLTVDLGADLIVKQGDQVTVIAQVDNPGILQSLVWNDIFDSTCVNNDFCFEQTFVPEKSVTLRVTLIDTAGCKAEDFVRIFVDDDPEVYAPNVFSPNADGSNDLFTVYHGRAVDRVFDLDVFDRWGNMVYHLDEVDGVHGWDGTHRGKTMPAGVYIYQFKVLLPDGKVKLYKGDVTLLR